MTDQVQITQPTIKEILANMTCIDTESNLLSAPKASGTFSDDGEEWSFESTYVDDSDFTITFEKEVNMSTGVKPLEFSIKYKKETWEVSSGTNAIAGTFIQILSLLSRENEEGNEEWEQYALMALEVPLEEIEAAA